MSHPAPLVEKGGPEVLLGSLVDAAEVRDSAWAKTHMTGENEKFADSPKENLAPVGRLTLEVGVLNKLVGLVEHNWNVEVRDHVL